MISVPPPQQSSHPILLIEDHRDLSEMIVEYLEQKGFVVDYAADGVSGLHLAVTNSYQLLILDVMLPGMDGLTICQKVRQEAKKDLPILMLTARDTLEDKIAGLEMGADDYLVKPFEVRELEARIKALIRRHKGELALDKLVVGDLELDPVTMKIYRQGKDLTLTPIAFQILKILMQSSPGVVTRRQIEHEIWGDEFPDSDALRSHLYTLRKVVDRNFNHPLIHTISGVGYRISDEGEK